MVAPPAFRLAKQIFLIFLYKISKSSSLKSSKSLCGLIFDSYKISDLR